MSVTSLQTGSDSVYDAMTPADRRAYAETTARFKVYGDDENPRRLCQLWRRQHPIRGQLGMVDLLTVAQLSRSAY